MSIDRSLVALAAELDALALEVVSRLTRAGDAAKGDRIAADEVFVLAGEVEASLSAAAARLSALRAELDRSARVGG
jgi:hypothetical protein